METIIKLKNVHDIERFVRLASTIPEDIKVKSGVWVVNGKSILGLYSLGSALETGIIVDIPKSEYAHIFSEFL